MKRQGLIEGEKRVSERERKGEGEREREKKKEREGTREIEYKRLQ